MKTLFYLLILSPLACFGQDVTKAFKAKFYQGGSLSKIELKDKMLKYNFDKIWTTSDNSEVYGFIGEKYQRLRIKLISVKKDLASDDQYNVGGKSMVKNNICDFKGILKITTVRKYIVTSAGVDNEYKRKGIIGEYSIFGTYLFSEDNKQTQSGIFKGVFQSDFYLTKDGKIHYDDIEMASDGFSNNLFIGNWTSYDKQIAKICNWGDYRIPNSGDLDIGAGDFSPNVKYAVNGWQNLSNTGSRTVPLAIKAREEENRVWWK